MSFTSLALVGFELSIIDYGKHAVQPLPEFVIDWASTGQLCLKEQHQSAFPGAHQIWRWGGLQQHQMGSVVIIGQGQVLAPKSVLACGRVRKLAWVYSRNVSSWCVVPGFAAK